MTRVKICGCMRADDAVAAAEAGADFIGILFAESRRRVSREEAAQIVVAVGAPMREVEQEAPPAARAGGASSVAEWFTSGARALDRLLARKRPLVVGVFEDQPIEEVNEIADDVGLDLVQLSGNESWDDCLLANRQAIKVIRPRAAAYGDEPMLLIEGGTAIAVMLDGSRGTGAHADLRTAEALAARLPLWLAGGLTPANVGAAIALVRPWCVDLSTGVETDGAKDPAKIAAFMRAVRDSGGA
ncbi:MAG: phosphoribosylanthranilate isomerase [Dehalococcoidia bacterium]|nr:phosphoribosylanthranilate isomerase [Dehalococcoidia bacterium]